MSRLLHRVAYGLILVSSACSKHESLIAAAFAGKIVGYGLLLIGDVRFSCKKIAHAARFSLLISMLVIAHGLGPLCSSAEIAQRSLAPAVLDNRNATYILSDKTGECKAN